MEDALFGIKDFDSYLVIGILMFFGIIETVSGFLKNTKRTKGDWIQEFGGFLVLSMLIKPGIVLAVLLLGSSFFPEYQSVLRGQNIGLLIVGYLLIDDILQYWYHRSAHEFEFLWKLHRPHHQAEEMGFFVSYRNAALYYVMMPNLWWVALVTFIGGGKAVAIGLVIKQLVIIGSHSTLPWDKVLYKHKIFQPLATLLERVIVTPAFHHAHHGKSMRDGISDPNGNFGNMFSIWDQLFGTAKFTRQFPTDYGLENDPKEHWTAAYLYPMVSSNDKESEISRGYKKLETKQMEAAKVRLKKGEKYLWCRCGKSKNQPFCDGTHHGSKIKPMLFEVKRTGDFNLCQCKMTKTGPFCDNSHLAFKTEKETTKFVNSTI